jgi:hypothetical protein
MSVDKGGKLLVLIYINAVRPTDHVFQAHCKSDEGMIMMEELSKIPYSWKNPQEEHLSPNAKGYLGSSIWPKQAPKMQYQVVQQLPTPA